METTTSEVYSHSTYEDVTTMTEVQTLTHYTTETRVVTAGYWTHRAENCSPYYTYEKRPVARGALGLIWMILDGIMWGAFFLVKGKAMSYLQAIRVKEDMEAHYNAQSNYDDSVYSFDKSMFNF